MDFHQIFDANGLDDSNILLSPGRFALRIAYLMHKKLSQIFRSAIKVLKKPREWILVAISKFFSFLTL